MNDRQKIHTRATDAGKEPKLDKTAEKFGHISVSQFENEELERGFVEEIDNSYRELQPILPDLPEVLRITFAGRDNYGSKGTDGYAMTADEIGIAIQPDFANRSLQLKNIRSLVFHEGYHMRQGFHYGAGEFSALESAIYEGCATVFERDYTDSEPHYGDYSQEGEETLQRWYEAMKSITAEQYFEPSGETWKKWAFYDSETDEQWRVYKVGTWLVDTILKEQEVTVVDLVTKSGKEILALIENKKVI